RQHEVDRMVRTGTWHKVTGTSLAGKTIGIVGMGSAGRALAGRAFASSMKVLVHDVVEVAPAPEFEVVTLEQLVERSDVISLHVPATPETRHLIDEDAIQSMKDGVWLINTSRGALVDEKELVRGLEKGRVGGAALDVFEEEPIRPDNPLLGFENVIFGSHNGSNTHEAVARTTERAVTNLIQGLREKDH
ncbi:MAG: NAD(P)-dependent oxidoreductase, partial [Acidimicrobiia bacterium]